MTCPAFVRRGLRPVILLMGTGIVAAPAAAQLVAAGQTLATSGAEGVVACATCHGPQGEGMAAAGFPYLAGQGAAYLALQLQDFAKGTRQNPIMEPIAKALEPTQIDAVAAYYAQLPKPFDARTLSEQTQTYPDKNDLGAWIADRGDWDNNIPACIQCHGPGGIGVGTHFPALAGLSATYIQEQLMAWKEDKRASGPLSLMGDIARRMNEAQITAVASHFSELSSATKDSTAATATPASQGAKQ